MECFVFWDIQHKSETCHNGTIPISLICLLYLVNGTNIARNKNKIHHISQLIYTLKKKPFLEEIN